MKKILLIILIIVIPVFAHPDILSELETYINSRIYNTPPPEGGHCGFRWQIELNLHFHELSPDMQKLAKTLMQPPGRQDSIISPSGHFMLHYDTTGYHAVPSADSSGNGVPDYIDSAAVIFDHVWQVEVDEMGFQAPPNQEGETVDIYHVYFTKFRYYGLTCFTMEDIPSLPGINYTSYIEIHSNFESGFYTKGLDALKVTAAHEFNHAIQLGYQFRGEDIFFMEMTSTWMEDYVYNQVNDYIQYLDKFIPDISNISFNVRDGWLEYGNSIYLHMLEKQYSPEMIVQIWEQIITEESLEALDTILKEYASSFAHSQNIYASWLYFTGERTVPGQFFPEAANYPQMEVDSGKAYIEKPLNKLSMRHVRLFPSKSYIYKARIQSDVSAGMFNHIIKSRLSGEPVNFNQSQIFSVTKNDPLIAVLTNPTNGEIDDLEYELILKSVTPQPNPVIVKTGKHEVTFTDVPPNSQITIFDLLGRRIGKLRSDNSENGELSWNLKNRYNSQVASGIYIYTVEASGVRMNGKFVVVR